MVTKCQIWNIRWGGELLFMIICKCACDPSCVHLPILQLFSQSTINGALETLRGGSSRMICQIACMIYSTFMTVLLELECHSLLSSTWISVRPAGISVTDAGLPTFKAISERCKFPLLSASRWFWVFGSWHITRMKHICRRFSHPCMTWHTLLLISDEFQFYVYRFMLRTFVFKKQITVWTSHLVAGSIESSIKGRLSNEDWAWQQGTCRSGYRAHAGVVQVRALQMQQCCQ